ncbi:DUF3788 domain-containing protein [Fusibacter bizertensis]
MLDKIPSSKEMSELLGDDIFKVWQETSLMVDGLYDMERLWNTGGKAWKYEYKYRRGGKTLCALYARENCFGFMIIFGKNEREKFESNLEAYSAVTQSIYDKSTTYHDGKWMMFELTDTSLFDDLKKLLAIKRRPNKK